MNSDYDIHWIWIPSRQLKAFYISSAGTSYNLTIASAIIASLSMVSEWSYAMLKRSSIITANFSMSSKVYKDFFSIDLIVFFLLVLFFWCFKSFNAAAYPLTIYCSSNSRDDFLSLTFLGAFSIFMLNSESDWVW